jgi:hypothetical protein
MLATRELPCIRNTSVSLINKLGLQLGAWNRARLDTANEKYESASSHLVPFSISKMVKKCDDQWQLHSILEMAKRARREATNLDPLWIVGIIFLKNRINVGL